jgi:hypothetical protein
MEQKPTALQVLQFGHNVAELANTVENKKQNALFDLVGVAALLN